MLSGEATNTYFIVFGLTWSGLEHTIYHTQGEHANHYTNDVVTIQNIYEIINNLIMAVYTENPEQ